jgi:tetratricopeptide (TPR) repeat protein
MDDYCHDFAAAADYYIEADRLQTTDLVLRGRINSCMGFICKQDSCFVEALEFYERANKAFYKIGDERRIANGLVSIAEQYVNLKEYDKVDSVLSLASRYEIDSAYYARMVDVRALALYNQEMYDSALVCLLRIKNTPRPIEARCYSYMKIMHCYEFLHQLDNTIIYAEYIISNSKNPAYRSNAYFFLIEAEKVNQDMQRVVNYSHLREDENRNIRTPNESCAQATMKFKAYLNDIDYTNLIISIVAALFVVLSIGIWLVYKCYRGVLLKHAKEKQDRRDLLARRIYDHSIYFTSNKIWKDSKKLRELGNNHFSNMFYRLEDTYHLSE